MSSECLQQLNYALEPPLARLLERLALGDELAVDQAALTGESLPVAVPREDSEGEPGSGKKLWSGSILKTGECEAFVTETGLNTMIGEAAKSIQCPPNVRKACHTVLMGQAFSNRSTRRAIHAHGQQQRTHE